MGSLQHSLPLGVGNFQGQGCVHVVKAFLLLVQTCALSSGRLNIPKGFSSRIPRSLNPWKLRLFPWHSSSCIQFYPEPGAVGSLLVPGAWAGRAWLGQLVTLLGTAASLLSSMIFKLDLRAKSGNGWGESWSLTQCTGTGMGVAPLGCFGCSRGSHPSMPIPTPIFQINGWWAWKILQIIKLKPSAGFF